MLKGKENLKTVYTITYHHVLNHGGVLQAYALVRILREEGYDACIIDYRPWSHLKHYYCPAKGLRRTLEKIRRERAFRSFRNRHLPTTDQAFFSRKSLEKLPPGAAYITGSDQVWNAKILGGNLDPAYFLSFSPKGSAILSYAASSGQTVLTEHSHIVSPLLNRFDWIGVREDSLLSEAGQLAPGIATKLVLDPSLLLEDYNEIIDTHRVPDSPYVVSYMVAEDDLLPVYNERVRQIRNATGLPVYHIGARQNIDAADRNFLDLGPSEWLGFIRNAKWMITSSFHGTAFSVIMKKNFVVVPHSVDALNRRSLTLLDSLGLQNRFIDAEGPLYAEDFVPIDYSMVTPKLTALRRKSLSALFANLP